MFHCDAMRQVPEAHWWRWRIPSLSQSQEGQEKFNVIFHDPDELLQRPDIDAVTLGTPSGLHMDIAIKAAQAKKHVLTEKPIEVTLEKADRMIQTCRRHGVKLGVISQRRWDRGMKELKEAVDSGALGKLILGEAYVKWYRTQQYYDSGKWRGTWELDGGGCLMNQGVHTVDCLQWVMGDVAEVTARTALLAHEKIEVEDIAQALITQNGAWADHRLNGRLSRMDERIGLGTSTMIMNKATSCSARS